MTAQQFGKYRLIERIAVGGTAEVFRAAMVWPDGREEPVVLKKILPQHAKDAYFRRLFREEALVIASLQHPNIVRIRDFGRLQGTFFLALEYVDGADLDTLLSASSSSGGAAPSGAVATFIALQIAKALDYIHTRTSSQQTPLRIVHRDVSPHNILISRQGEVKLADFGIAKSIIRADRTTEGTIKGKFAYMSPEQATPGDEVDARTDIFSLGAVLYEMLLGDPPFLGRTDVETLERVRRCHYELDEERLPPPHRALRGVLDRCLQRLCDQRYPDAAAVAAALEAHLASLEHPADSAAVAAWVERSIGQGAESSMEQLVSDMLGAPARGGGTAMLSGGRVTPHVAAPAERAGDWSVTVDPTAETVPPERPGPIASRTGLLILLLVVAGITAAVTLAASGYFSRDLRPMAPDAAPAAVAAAVVDARGPRAAPDLAQQGSPSDSAPSDSAAPAPDAAPRPFLPIRVRRKRPRSRSRQRGGGGRGRLTVNSIPWARVYLDGRLLGTTPLRGVSVPAGNHRIVLKDGAGRRLRTFVTRIDPGQKRTFSFDQSRP